MMKTVTKDTKAVVKYLKELQDIQWSTILTEKNEDWSVWKTCVYSAWEEKLCHVHKSSEAGTRPWTKLDKIYRVIKFNQEVWLKPYIDMNTELRAKAKNDFEKDFFKLMNNSVWLWRM